MLDWLLRATPFDVEFTDLAAWLAHDATCPFEGRLDRALWAGFESDRLGYAFASGYQAALARLVDGPAETRRSLAATEAGGGHPRAIETTLSEAGSSYVLRGVKTFATMASVADELLVVANAGERSDGKKKLVLVRTKPSARGVLLEERSPTPFAPEIPHAKLTLNDVAVEPNDVLVGDGYDDYLKPFRTIEDIHVLAAVIGFFVRVARTSDWPHAHVERALMVAEALGGLAVRDPASPSVHLALAGAFDAAHPLFERADGSCAAGALGERIARDAPLLRVAEVVRRKRTDAARRTLATR